MKVIKKDGTHEGYDFMKIKNAVTKSAKRVMIDLDDEAFDRLKDIVELRLSLLNTELIPIADMHNVVEESLEQFDPRIAKSYKDYRNYKKDFVHMMDKVYQKSQSIRFIGDKENANTDSTLVATKRCLIFNDLNKRLYRKFFMTQEELQACKDGYIYVHGVSVVMEVVSIIMKNLPSCKNEIYTFLSGLSGMTVKEIGNLDMVTFTEMIVAVVQKQEFKDFFKVVSKLFK